MNRQFVSRALCAVLVSGAIVLPAKAINFGKKEESAEVKVTKGGPLKGKTSLAIGAFRVSFKTHDEVVSVGGGALMGGRGSSVRDDTTMSGVDQALMQKIADQVYADFVQQATAKGYTVIDSAKLATQSPAYKALPTTVNFAEGPLGAFVIPIGQTSPVLATDDYKQDRHGAQTTFGGFKGVGVQMATTEANSVFPKLANETGSAVIAVNIVVNFAAYKGTQSTWLSNSKATVDFGATIEGVDQQLLGTMVKVWDAKSSGCGTCMGQAHLQGDVHSSEAIGTFEKRDALGVSGATANAIGMLSGVGKQETHKAYHLTADPVAYEKNTLTVAKQANEMLLDAMVKER